MHMSRFPHRHGTFIPVLSIVSIDPLKSVYFYSAGRRGIEFVVDCGPYVGPIVGSTVIGMSTGAIEVFRVGKGDASLFEGY